MVSSIASLMDLPLTYRYHIVDWHGTKTGIMGLVEYEWLATLATLNADDVRYIDFAEEGKRLCKVLRDEGCEVVVALTHMRMPNDKRLGAEVPDIDIILGGHDHHSEVTSCPPHGTLVVKSGTDFRELSIIHMQLHGDSKTVCLNGLLMHAAAVSLLLLPFMTPHAVMPYDDPDGELSMSAVDASRRLHTLCVQP
jgi:2',3'-cyclic-nucleotide 2'-phosphodiesterase (5'-nucleotidase family)